MLRFKRQLLRRIDTFNHILIDFARLLLNDPNQLQELVQTALGHLRHRRGATAATYSVDQQDKDVIMRVGQRDINHLGEQIARII